MRRLSGYGVLDGLDAVAVHGFPLDWNHWQIDEWPERIAEIEAVTALPIWVTEVGVSTFGAEEVQVFGLRRTAELLLGRVPRVFWYSLFDLPKAWPATTRHREAEGSSYYRHFHMGLLREDGSPKLACSSFPEFTPGMGICQWFHFEDHRLDDAVRWLKRLGVRQLRTGLSWADSFRPDAERWFDRQMRALDGFDVTVTFCFTPEHRGVQPHHTSPPQRAEEFAEFCARMVGALRRQAAQRRERLDRRCRARGRAARAGREQRVEVGDRLLQPFLERDLRLPAEQLARQRDVGLALLRVVGRQRREDELRASSR